MTVSSDGVVTATVDTATASVLLTVDFTVTGSPIHATAGNVYTITVTEQTSGHGVRGLASANAPGGVAVGIDHEATSGVALSYVATAYDVSGALMGTSTTAGITIPLPTSGHATWIKSLTTPTSSVNLRVKTLPAWSGDIAQGVLQVIGNPYPVVVSDVRQAEAATIEVWTTTATATAALKALLNTPGPYLLQMPGYGEADTFVTVGKYERPRATNVAAHTYYAWTLPLTSVQRPDPVGWQVSVPGHTYADSQVRWPLYSNRTGTYASRANT